MLNAIWMILFFFLLLPYFACVEWGTKPEAKSKGEGPTVATVNPAPQQLQTRAALQAPVSVSGFVTPQERTMLKALAQFNPTITPDPTTGGAWASWDRGKRNVQLTAAQASEYRRLTNVNI